MGTQGPQVARIAVLELRMANIEMTHAGIAETMSLLVAEFRDIKTTIKVSKKWIGVLLIVASAPALDQLPDVLKFLAA